MSWRYLAQRARTGEILHWSLPLAAVEVTRTLSGPGRLSGTLQLGQVDAVGQDGLPLLDPWGTLVWAERGGEIVGGGILHSLLPEGETLTLDVMGVGGYPDSLPFLGTPWSSDSVDPLEVVRRAWADVLRPENGTFTVAVDGLTSPVRVGVPGWWEHTETETRVDSSAVTWTDGIPDSAYRWHEPELVELAPWATPDLGDTISRMCEAAGVDWLEHSAWAGESIAHRIELGAPIGARRDGMRLVVGENVAVLPAGLVDGAEVADTVLLRGAGEGEGMVTAVVAEPTHRLRRVAVVTDRAATDQTLASARARALLPAYRAGEDLDELRLIDHPNAPIGAIGPGDTLPLIADGGWMTFDGWARVRALTYRPEDVSSLTLTVEVVS